MALLLLAGIGHEASDIEGKSRSVPADKILPLYVFMSIIKFRHLVTRDTSAFTVRLNS